MKVTFRPDEDRNENSYKVVWEVHRFKHTVIFYQEEWEEMKKYIIREFLENNTTTEILMLKSNYEYIQEKKELEGEE